MFLPDDLSNLLQPCYQERYRDAIYARVALLAFVLLANLFCHISKNRVGPDWFQIQSNNHANHHLILRNEYNYLDQPSAS